MPSVACYGAYLHMCCCTCQRKHSPYLVCFNRTLISACRVIYDCICSNPIPRLHCAGPSLHPAARSSASVTGWQKASMPLYRARQVHLQAAHKATSVLSAPLVLL